MLRQYLRYMFRACMCFSSASPAHALPGAAVQSGARDVGAPARVLPRRHLIIAGVLLAVFLFLCLSNIRDYSPTYDELKFLSIGQELAGGAGWQTEMSVVHAPLSFYTHGFLLKPFEFSGELQRLRWARATMLVYSVALALLILVWATEVFGASGGVLALSLYVFNSNILAHSSLITTDIIYACFSLFLLYFFWKYLTENRTRWILACGVSFGGALLAKYSAVLYFFLLPVLGIVLVAARIFRRKESGAAAISRILVALAAIFIIAVLVLNIGYGFTGSFFRLGSQHYQSRLLSQLSENPVISWILAPAPFPFVRGYDAQKHISEVGHPAFLAGMRSTGGWWYYYFIAFLFKMPPAFWPLMVLTGAAIFRKADERQKTAALVLAFLSLAIIAAHSFLSRSQAGFRYILVALPPLFVLGGSIPILARRRWEKVLVLILVIFYSAPALWIHPHHITYFSAFAGGPSKGYRWLSDSNLDWGQDAEKARRFIRDSSEPVIINPGMFPVPGRVLISATTLQDCFSLHDIHGWLREFEPTADIGYSWLIYDIDERKVAARPADKRRLPDEYYFAAFAYARDHLEQAEELAQAALISHSGLPEVYYLLGLARLGLGDRAGAAGAFAAVPQSHPLYVDALTQRAFIAALEKDGVQRDRLKGEAALEETLRSYARRPDRIAGASISDVDAYKRHNNQAVILWGKGNLLEAEQEMRAALQIQPKFVEGLANLAVILEERGSFAEALEAAERYNAQFLLLENSPYRDYRVYYENCRVMLGETLEIHPKPDADILRLKDSLARRPHDAAALNQLVILLMKRGRFTEAYERIAQGLAAAIDGSGALYNDLAVLYTEKKMFPDAIAACRRALEMNPKNSSAADLLGLLEARLPQSGQGTR